MKIIIEYKEDEVRISSEDDPKNHYLVAWRKSDNMYSLWYNEQFIWEKSYNSFGEALGNVVANLTDGMRVQKG